MKVQYAITKFTAHTKIVLLTELSGLVISEIIPEETCLKCE
jgi:hypothetical protein